MDSNRTTYHPIFLLFGIVSYALFSILAYIIIPKSIFFSAGVSFLVVNFINSYKDLKKEFQSQGFVVGFPLILLTLIISSLNIVIWPGHVVFFVLNKIFKN